MKNHPIQILAVCVLVLMLLGLMLFPLYILIKISVSPPTVVFQERPPYAVTEVTFAHFRGVFQSGAAFWAPLKKSFLVALWASVLSLLIAVPAAYGISRLDYRWRYLFLIGIFTTRMIPEVSIALPIATTFIKLGLFDTVAGLVLAHLIKILPISCFILVGTFSDFPQDLQDQAMIDGCSRLQALIKVVLPCSLMGIIVAAIFSFLFSWDEFIYASYLTLAEPTMPLKMYYYVSRGNIFYSATYAVMITLPVIVLTLSLQKYFKPEYLSGGVKG